MKETLLLCFKLGCLGFGGPLSVIAQLEEECVQRRRWISKEEFAENLAVIKTFPGPVAAQIVIRIAALRAGKAAGFWGGVLFILPAFFLVLLLGLCLSGAQLGPQQQIFEKGLNASALAVMLLSSWRLTKGNINSKFQVLVSLLSFFTVFTFPRWEPVVILLFGFWGIRRSSTLRELGTLILLFLICLKGALLCFGTGLAIVPLLQVDVVERLALISQNDFLQAATLGQITPGPILIMATWVGYKAAGFVGALVATIGVFGPSFIVILLLLPRLIEKLKKSPAFKRFLYLAVPAVVGAIGAGIFKMMIAAAFGPYLWAIFATCMILLLWKPLPAWFIIPLGGFMAILVSMGRS